MRIGVLTLPLHTNYGGILQAYALQRVLQDMGHDVVLLDSYPQCPTLKPFPLQQMFYLKRLLMKIVAPHKAIPLFYEKEAIVHYFKKTHIRQFYRQHVLHVPFGVGTTLNPNDFDVLIVGSDQVWRPMYSPNIFDAYLSFAQSWSHVKRIAYAASFGTAEWEYSDEQTSECRRLAQMFAAVSVREESGVTLCKEHLGIDASWVLDPTLLVDPRHYMEHIKRVPRKFSSRMFFSYMLDETEEKNSIIQHIIESYGYYLIVCKNIDDAANVDLPSVESWLRSFYDAEFVFTDSFHGCVFSIIFNKPFVVYGNVNRGMARFHSLLSQFGLEDRLVTTLEEAVRVVPLPIDWDRVNNSLSGLRKKSQEFLIAALGSLGN